MPDNLDWRVDNEVAKRSLDKRVSHDFIDALEANGARKQLVRALKDTHIPCYSFWQTIGLYL